MAENFISNYFILALPAILFIIGLFWIASNQLSFTLLTYIFFPAIVALILKLPYLILKLLGTDSGFLRFSGNMLMFLSLLIIPISAYQTVKFFHWNFIKAIFLGLFATTFYTLAIILAFSLEDLKDCNIIGTFFTTWGVFSDITSLFGIFLFSAFSFFLGALGWGIAKIF